MQCPDFLFYILVDPSFSSQIEEDTLYVSQNQLQSIALISACSQISHIVENTINNTFFTQILLFLRLHSLLLLHLSLPGLPLGVSHCGGGGGGGGRGGAHPLLRGAGSVVGRGRSARS